MNSPTVIILAAGLGKRMRSAKLKVLHKVGGLTLIEHSVRLAIKLKPQNIVVVIPPNDESIPKVFKNFKAHTTKLSFAVQPKALGTGHALRCGLDGLGKLTSPVVVLNADMPLVSLTSVKKLLTLQKNKKCAVSLLSVLTDPIKGFGRIVRDDDSNVTGIVEERDATAVQKKITEFNVGIYAFDGKFLSANITKLQNKNKQREYYLTDLVALAKKAKLCVCAVAATDNEESLGVNSQADLQRLNAVFYRLQRDKMMEDGVTLLGCAVFADADVRVKAGVTIESPCYLKGNTCVANGTHIKAFSYLDDAQVGCDCQIGPFAHLRPGTVLKTGAKVGNFVETKKTTLGEYSKANHLTYLGDAEIGNGVNIGAGTITCNYDGVNKFKTILEDGVFIGSDTQLVAPVTIGKGAFVGAGTTITKDVAAGSLAVSRTPQKEIPGWALRRKSKA